MFQFDIRFPLIFVPDPPVATDFFFKSVSIAKIFTCAGVTLDLLTEITLAIPHAGYAIFMKNRRVLECTGVLDLFDFLIDKAIGIKRLRGDLLHQQLMRNLKIQQNGILSSWKDMFSKLTYNSVKIIIKGLESRFLVFFFQQLNREVNYAKKKERLFHGAL